MKHAHPVRSNRCVDLPCLLYSCFSCPPDSRTRRAIAPGRIRPPGCTRSRSPSPPTVKRLSGFPEIALDLPNDPRIELIGRIFLTIFPVDASHPDQPHNFSAYLVYEHIRKIMKFVLPSCQFSCPPSHSHILRIAIIRCHIEYRVIRIWQRQGIHAKPFPSKNRFQPLRV